MKTQTLKGFRDFLPKEARKRQFVLDTLRKVFESYGFEPLETPALEYEEVLLGKYGDEGDKLMYRFEDNGKRRVALRYDQTVPLARVVAQYGNDLPLPFKRYQIQNVWRAENTQKGRYREFLQVDIDTVGSSSPLSDAEIIQVAYRSLKQLGFKEFKIYVNDRTIFSGISNEKIREVDKINKEINDEARNRLVENFIAKNPQMKKVINAKKTDRITKVFSALESMGISGPEIEFMPILARGLDYYTGIIFEIEIKNFPIGSLAGGGRYDNLIGMFAGKDIPAVGFAFGFDRLIEAMDELNLFNGKNLGGVKILVTNTSDKAPKIAEELRNQNINAELYVDEKDIDKQLRYADRKGIPYVLIVDDKLTLKNMKTGEQKEVTMETLPDELR